MSDGLQILQLWEIYAGRSGSNSQFTDGAEVWLPAYQAVVTIYTSVFHYQIVSLDQRSDTYVANNFYRVIIMLESATIAMEFIFLNYNCY